MNHTLSLSSKYYIDFRGRRDALGFDYFESSVQATLANRQFCIDQAANFQTYSSNVWGLSACDKPGGGYEAYGIPLDGVKHDGTVSPWNTAASIVFTPDLVTAAVSHMREKFGPRLWGRYGFSGAFNLDKNWFADDVIGIDAGAALLMIENHRTGLIWKTFTSLPAIQNGLKKAGFPR